MKSVLEIIESVAVEYSDLLNLDKSSEVDINDYVLISRTKLKPLRRTLTKFGFTVSLIATRQTNKFIHKKIVESLCEQLEDQPLFVERFDSERRTKRSNGLRDLESEYLNVTVKRKLQELNLPKPDATNRVFLFNYNEFNDSLSKFLVKYGLAELQNYFKDHYQYRVAVHYKLIEFINSELMFDKVFKKYFVN
ncbi:hypothetical protein P3552_02010 [Vibrio parahaemolyticus]|uniref:hypothetical protein n=2 Tax=Vibrio parahaemolyticus TaxID=670 RepID=UPI001F35CC79|nr:hypothetical protein [Vibrio parahaemolyticus]MCG0010889.1 hypothetical protein [Vibrio parahaemolyticus]MDF4725888.1 hypothetical protein [Vibrio parahaemolyticus]MDF4952480.1 hypothetical protein [Vibrio parahaemolyticus]MDL1996823.1 hypothetical protein [Vibrio parahaemolyticus]